MSMTENGSSRTRPTKRAAALASAVLVAACLAASLPANAALGRGEATPPTLSGPVSVRSVTPDTVYAEIARITPNNNALTVGVGPDLGDPIYVGTEGSSLQRVDSSTFAITGTVGVGGYPLGIAVTSDDTVYVVNAQSNNMSVVRGQGMTVAGTVSLPNEPQTVALSRLVDDTIFVSTKSSQVISMLSADNPGGARIDTSLGNEASPYGLAVSQDDTVFISSYGANAVYQFNPRTAVKSTAASVSGSNGPIGVAVSSDDTVYFSVEGQDLVKAYPMSDPSAATSVTVGGQPQGITLGLDGTVFVANRSSGSVSIINPLTLTLEGSVNVVSSPSAIVTTASGLIVTASRYSRGVSVVAAVTPTLMTTVASAGSVGTMSLAGLPAGVLVDDSAVASVSFDGVSAPDWVRVAGTNTWSGPIPAGSGTVPVVVGMRGGNTAGAGNFTYYVAPPPPPTPASAPTNVTAVAGDRSADVTWAAPPSSGSFAISNYRVTSTPGGHTCITTTLSCAVSGLANGTSYRFTVAALTGAGWGAESSPSNAVTPAAPPRPDEVIITITGSRSDGVISIAGEATGMGLGGIVVPWSKKSGRSFVQGRDVAVGDDGSFTWSRVARKGRVWTVYFAAGEVRSNVLVMRTR